MDKKMAEANNGVGGDMMSENRKRDFKKALSQVPRYTGTTPWRLWKVEFNLWCRVHEVAEDEAAKLALLTSMRGAAVQKISPYGCDSITWRQFPTFQGYLAQIEQIFAPPAESELSRIEFSQRVQGRHETVTSYLAAKYSLYDNSYGTNEQSEPSLITATINGLYSSVIKRMTRRGNPVDRVQLQTLIIQAVANERSAYHDGYAESTNLDGLGATTVHLTSEQGGNEGNGDEPMDISTLDREKRCYKCGKMGHVQGDCRVRMLADGSGPVLVPTWRGGNRRSGDTRNAGNPRRSESQKCYNCDKPGHFARDCRGPKKPRREVEVLQDGVQDADYFLDVGPETKDVPW